MTYVFHSYFIKDHCFYGFTSVLNPLETLGEYSDSLRVFLISRGYPARVHWAGKPMERVFCYFDRIFT